MFCGKTIQAASRREFLEKSGLGFGALAADRYCALAFGEELLV